MIDIIKNSSSLCVCEEKNCNVVVIKKLYPEISLCKKHKSILNSVRLKKGLLCTPVQ